MMLKVWLKKWRIGLVLLGLVALLLASLVRLSMLQIFDVDGGVNFLKDQGEARSVRSEIVKADRGMILDRNGKPLAVSTPVESIWANPKEIFQYRQQIQQSDELSEPQKAQLITQQKQRLAQLAQLLHEPADKLAQRLASYKNKQFIYLDRKLAPDLVDQIMSLDIKGIYS